MNLSMIQGTEEWKELRKQYIGASDAAVIMGLSPWSTPHQLWMVKKGLHEVEVNWAMRRGLEKEDVARGVFEKMLDTQLFPKVMMCPTHTFMMASLDGISMDHSVLVEIKVAGPTDHALAAEGHIPTKYYPQLQHQMSVTGLEKMYYGSWSEDSAYLIEVKRDQGFIESMIEAEAEFYLSMQSDTPPALGDKDVAPLTEEEEKVARELREVLLAKKELEKKEKALKETLLSSVCMASEGGGLSITPVYRKGTVNYAKLVKDNNLDVEPYRGSGSASWRINVK